MWMSRAHAAYKHIAESAIGSLALDWVAKENKAEYLECFAQAAVLKRPGHLRYTLVGGKRRVLISTELRPCNVDPVAVVAFSWDIPGKAETLTKRERDVAMALIKTGSAKRAARSCGIAMSTLETHRANVYRKLGVSDPVALCRFAIRAGMLEP